MEDPSQYEPSQAGDTDDSLGSEGISNTVSDLIATPRDKDNRQDILLTTPFQPFARSELDDSDEATHTFNFSRLNQRSVSDGLPSTRNEVPLIHVHESSSPSHKTTLYPLTVDCPGRTHHDCPVIGPRQAPASSLLSPEATSSNAPQPIPDCLSNAHEGTNDVTLEHKPERLKHTTPATFSSASPALSAGSSSSPLTSQAARFDEGSPPFARSSLHSSPHNFDSQSLAVDRQTQRIDASPLQHTTDQNGDKERLFKARSSSIGLGSSPTTGKGLRSDSTDRTVAMHRISAAITPCTSSTNTSTSRRPGPLRPAALRPVGSGISPNKTRSRPLSTNANRDMNDTLQIVAHTWSKLQSSFSNEQEELTRQLQEATQKQSQLTEQLKRAQQLDEEQALQLRNQRSQLSNFKTKTAGFKTFVQGLCNDINALRKEANTHRRILEDHERNTLAEKDANSIIIANYASGSTDAMCIVREAMKLVQQQQIQLRESTFQADYLVLHLEEKTGLLAEARDELAMLRQRKSGLPTVDLEQILSSISTGQNHLLNQLETSLAAVDAESLISSDHKIMNAMETRQNSGTLNMESVKEAIQALSDQIREHAHQDKDVARVSPDTISQLLEDHLATAMTKLRSELGVFEVNAELEAKSLHESLRLQSELDKAIQRAAGHDTEASNLRSSINLLQEDNNMLKAELLKASDKKDSDRQADIEQAVKEIALLKVQLSAQSLDMSGMEAAKCVLEEELACSLVKAENLAKVVNSVVAERDEVKQKLAESDSIQATSARKFLAEQKASFENERRAVNRERDVLETKLAAMSEKKDSLEQRLHQASIDNDELTRKMQSAAEEQALRAHSNAMEEELAMLREQVESHQTAQITATSEMEKEQKKNEDSVASLELELSAVKERMLQVREESEQLRKSCDKALTDEREKWQKSLESLQESLAHKETELGKSDTEAKSFRVQVDRMWKVEEQRNVSRAAEFKSSIDELTLAKSEAESKIQRLCEKLEAAELSIAELQRPSKSTKIDADDKNVDVLEPSSTFSGPPSFTQNPSDSQTLDQEFGSPDSALREASAFLNNISTEDQRSQVQRASADTIEPCTAPRLQSPAHLGSSGTVVPQTQSQDALPISDLTSFTVVQPMGTTVGPLIRGDFHYRKAFPQSNTSSKLTRKSPAAFETPKSSTLSQVEVPQVLESSSPAFMDAPVTADKYSPKTRNSLPWNTSMPLVFGTTVPRDPNIATSEAYMTPRVRTRGILPSQPKSKRPRLDSVSARSESIDPQPRKKSTSTSKRIAARTPKRDMRPPQPQLTYRKQLRTSSRATRSTSNNYDERFSQELRSSQH